MAIADVYMLRSMILWGIFAALQGVIRTYSLLFVDRFRGGTKSGAAFSFMAASPLPAELPMFLVKRPRGAAAENPRADRRWAVASPPSLQRGVHGRPLPDGAPLSPTCSGRPKLR
jgi:hypothetical protein